MQSGSPVTCTFADLFKPPANSNVVPDIHAALAARVSQPYASPTGQGCILLAQVNLPASGAITPAMVDNSIRPIVVSSGLLLEVIFCLAQRVQQLSGAVTNSDTNPHSNAQTLGGEVVRYPSGLMLASIIITTRDEDPEVLEATLAGLRQTTSHLATKSSSSTTAAALR